MKMGQNYIISQMEAKIFVRQVQKKIDAALLDLPPRYRYILHICLRKGVHNTNNHNQ